MRELLSPGRVSQDLSVSSAWTRLEGVAGAGNHQVERLDCEAGVAVIKSQMTAHGFRSMASTLLNENGFPPDHIERQLAHVEGNSVRAAYNYAEYLPERRKMMQWWADYLDELRTQ